jgi:uncharacterized SAM-binding protein YcdF (DUF218 family)
MKLLAILVPHLLYIIGLVAFLLVLTCSTTFQTVARLQIPALIGTILSYTLIFLVLVGFIPDQWIKAQVTPDWQKEIHEADTAVVLGFGYEEDKSGTMQAGEANKFLLDWVVNNTAANTIFVQEGVWVAACPTSATHCTYKGRELRRIHQHDDKAYLNTLDSAFCAIEQMATFNKNKAILVTHDLQLQRAAWDFERVKQKPDWLNFTFVVPEIPDTPYPTNSIHWQTQNQFIYKTVELLISRPRDYFSSVPNHCKAPLP